MKRLRSHGPKPEGDVGLDKTPSTELAIGITETPRARIKRIMSENPVIIFSRPSCCMSLVMKSLLSAVGAQPTVIELEENEIPAASKVCGGSGKFALPSLSIGGACVGGLESMMGLHLSNDLVPRLERVDAIKKEDKK